MSHTAATAGIFELRKRVEKSGSMHRTGSFLKKSPPDARFYAADPPAVRRKGLCSSPGPIPKILDFADNFDHNRTTLSACSGLARKLTFGCFQALALGFQFVANGSPEQGFKRQIHYQGISTCHACAASIGLPVNQVFVRSLLVVTIVAFGSNNLKTVGCWRGHQ